MIVATLSDLVVIFASRLITGIVKVLDLSSSEFIYDHHQEIHRARCTGNLVALF
jgi:hypothetical protein